MHIGWPKLTPKAAAGVVVVVVVLPHEPQMMKELPTPSGWHDPNVTVMPVGDVWFPGAQLYPLKPNRLTWLAPTQPCYLAREGLRILLTHCPNVPLTRGPTGTPQVMPRYVCEVKTADAGAVVGGDVVLHAEVLTMYELPNGSLWQ